MCFLTTLEIYASEKSAKSGLGYRKYLLKGWTHCWFSFFFFMGFIDNNRNTLSFKMGDELCHYFMVMISPPVDLLNNNCPIILYAVDTLGNNHCWVLFYCHQTEFTHNYICIYTKTPHFLYVLKNVHCSCFISYISIYIKK